MKMKDFYATEEYLLLKKICFLHKNSSDEVIYTNNLSSIYINVNKTEALSNYFYNQFFF